MRDKVMSALDTQPHPSDQARPNTWKMLNKYVLDKEMIKCIEIPHLTLPRGG